MTILAVLTLLFASFGAVAWPFLSERSGDSDRRPRVPPARDNLISQRDAAYQALKELEFEYNLGNLSDSDYDDLRNRYRALAAGILQRLDDETGVAEPETDPPLPDPAAARIRQRIEDNIAASGPQPDHLLSIFAELAGSRQSACPSCGGSIAAEDAYCWRCGSRVGRRCEECAEPLLDEDRFCAGCGRSLEAPERAT